MSWLQSQGELTLVGVEGTGSYGVGLARYLTRPGVTVVEVDRPNRQPGIGTASLTRSMPWQRLELLLSGQATGSPKNRDGNVEAIRVLIIARRSAADTRIDTLNQLRHLVFTATPEIRAKFTGLTAISLANRASGLRPRPGDDPVRYKPGQPTRPDQRVHPQNNPLDKHTSLNLGRFCNEFKARLRLPRECARSVGESSLPSEN